MNVQSRASTLVSAIIPAYNREDSLPATVRSVVANDHRPVEIVIVDDGSSDKTLTVARELAVAHTAPDVRFIVRHQYNQGAPAARNHGMDLSTGTYLFFLDSDDVITPHKISRQLAAMRRAHADLCVGDFEIHYLGEQNTEVKVVSNENARRKVILNQSVGCSSTLLHRDLATAVRWTESLPNYQDMDYFLKCLVLAKRVVHLPEVVYRYYRYASGTISTANRGRKIPFQTRLRSLRQDALGNKHYNSGVARARSLAAIGVLQLLRLKSQLLGRVRSGEVKSAT